MDNTQIEQYSEIRLDHLKLVELKTLAKMIEGLYFNVTNTFLAKRMLLIASVPYKYPECLYELLENLKVIHGVSSEILVKMEKYIKKEKLSDDYDIEFQAIAKLATKFIYETKYIEQHRIYNNILSRIIDLTNQSIKVGNIATTINDLDKFLELISKINQRIDSSLCTIVENSASIDIFNNGYQEGFKEVYLNFSELNDYPELFAVKPKEKNNGIDKLSSMVAGNKSVAYQAKSDPAEIERLASIGEANNLYEELTKDCIVDLRNQFSASSYDLYKDFVVKYQKFLSENAMPLRNNASTSQAKEICRQLKKLIANISYISEQSYVVSKCPEKGE